MLHISEFFSFFHYLFILFLRVIWCSSQIVAVYNHFTWHANTRLAAHTNTKAITKCLSYRKHFIVCRNNLIIAIKRNRISFLDTVPFPLIHAKTASLHTFLHTPRPCAHAQNSKHLSSIKRTSFLFLSEDILFFCLLPFLYFFLLLQSPFFQFP